MNLTRKQFFILLGCTAAALVIGILSSWRSRPLAEEPASKDKVWDYLEENAPMHGLDPHFVYAIAFAESSFDPTADSGYARGMMQLSRVAWDEVSDTSYRYAYDWHVNLDVGLDYLAFLKRFLEKHNTFSYPLLAACYRYGPYAVKDKGFQISRLDPPHNKIYKELFAGNTDPVKPPE